MNKLKSDEMSERFPPDTPLAMCYVPVQEFDETYAENTALEKGTIFPDLYFPFTGRGVGTGNAG